MRSALRATLAEPFLEAVAAMRTGALRRIPLGDRAGGAAGEAEAEVIVCPQCDGAGAIRKPGSTEDRDRLWEAAGLAKKGPGYRSR